MCLICCTIKVQAKYFKTPYLLEMAKSDAAPYVTSYIVGAKASDSMVFNGTIGNTISLKQSDLAVSFKESKEGLHTIILVDNSGSVDKGQFQIKTNCSTAKVHESTGQNDIIYSGNLACERSKE